MVDTLLVVEKSLCYLGYGRFSEASRLRKPSGKSGTRFTYVIPRVVKTTLTKKYFRHLSWLFISCNEKAHLLKIFGTVLKNKSKVSLVQNKIEKLKITSDIEMTKIKAISCD